MNKRDSLYIPIVLATMIVFFATSSLADSTMAPEGAGAYFISPENGAVVSSPVHVIMGLRGMGVAPGVQKTTKPGTIT